VTVIDPHMQWTIRADEFASMGRNCPFDGWTVRGRAIATIVAGQRVCGRKRPAVSDQVV